MLFAALKFISLEIIGHVTNCCKRPILLEVKTNRGELGASEKIKMAAAWRSNLGKYVREVRIHLCQKSQSSQGVR